MASANDPWADGVKGTWDNTGPAASGQITPPPDVPEGFDAYTGQEAKPYQYAQSAAKTYANPASFPDPQDHPEKGPITTIGYQPVSGDQPGRFTATTTPGEQGPISAAARANQVSVAPSAQQVRTQVGNADSAASRIYGQDRGRGLVSDAANPTRVQTVQDGGQPPAGGMTTEQANEYYGAQRRASEAANLQNRDAGVSRAGLVTSAIESRMAAEKAGRDASVAQFQAKNGADVVLRGTPTFDGKNASVDAARKNADYYSGVARDARGVALGRQTAADNAANPNYVTQAAEQQRTQIEGQKGVREQQAGGVALQQGTQNLATGAIDQKTKQLQLDAANALGAAKTPEERAAAQKQYLTLHGKLEPGWKAIHLAGEQMVDPSTGQVTKTGDKVVIYNEQTGEQQSHIVGSQPQGAQAPKSYPDGTTGTIDGKRVVWKNGKPVPQ